MRYLYLAVAAGLCLAVIPTAARADQFTISGANNISFSLPSSPVPDVVVPTLGFTINGVAVDVNGTSETENILFFEDGIAIGPQVSIAADPVLGFDITAPNAVINDFSVTVGTFLPFGDPLYTGTEASPTFVLGTHGLENQDTGDIDSTLTITADIAATPEPSSIALLGTGLVSVAGLIRKRRVC